MREFNPQQMLLTLEPSDGYAAEFFVPHSGVVDAIGAIEAGFQQVVRDPTSFRSVFLWGPPGSGKSHLIRYVIERFREFPREMLDVIPIGAAHTPGGVVGEAFASADSVSQIVALYEQRRSNGGFLIFESRLAPEIVSDNPHLASRFKAGVVCQLALPRDVELEPLIRSLAQRRNLQLSSHAIGYLCRRAARDPLSFDRLLDKMGRLSLSHSRPAGLSALREVLRGG